MKKRHYSKKNVRIHLGGKTRHPVAYCGYRPRTRRGQRGAGKSIAGI